MSLYFYAVLLCAVGAGRVLELFVSRRNRQRMMRDYSASPGNDPIFPLMVFLHVMPFWLIPLEIFTFGRIFAPALAIPMFTLFALATALRFWTLSTLGRYWNAQVMVPPDLEPVAVGPYRYIRHPNYVVVILELVSLPLIYSCYLSAAILSLLNAVVLYFRIRDEERLLLASEAYRKTMGHKPRFIPRWSR